MADKDALMQFFQQYLGREARPEELKYLGEYIDQGHLSTFEAGQLIQGLPEANQKNFGGYAKQYEQALAGSDSAILDKAGKQLQGQYAAQGRPDTSSYGAAYMSAARDLAISRQPAIAQFYGQGLQSQYAQPGQQSYRTQERGQNLQDRYQQRSWDMEDYYRQKNDYNDYLNASNRRNRQQAIGGAVGMAGGAALGGIFGGPMGAAYGSKLGGQFGSYAGGF